MKIVAKAVILNEEEAAIITEALQNYGQILGDTYQDLESEIDKAVNRSTKAHIDYILWRLGGDNLVDI